MLAYSDLPDMGAALALVHSHQWRLWWVSGWGQAGWAGSLSASLFAWLTLFPRELGGLLLPTPQKRNKKGQHKWGPEAERD